MKYVINIKRKPSIIKKEKKEWGKRTHLYIYGKSFSTEIFVSVERHINIRNENLWLSDCIIECPFFFLHPGRGIWKKNKGSCDNEQIVKC